MTMGTTRKVYEKKRAVGRIAIVSCQHVLLWTGLYISTSTIWTLIIGSVTFKDIPSVVLLLVSSVVSIFYVALHNAATKVHTSARSLRQCERADTLRSLTIFTLRILWMLWAITAAVNITVTTSRRALCVLDSRSEKVVDAMPLDRGTTCVVNRTAILASFVALLTSALLFLLLSRTESPFRCRLFGIVEEHRLLPHFLANHKTAKLAMRSEMSFKCRSSTSVETEAPAPGSGAGLVLAKPTRNSSANLLPPNPRNALGLGIYTSRTASSPAILTPPKPGLKTLRSHSPAYIAPMPPSSPPPPLPAYMPLTYRARNAPHCAGTPQRPARPTRTRSFVTRPVARPCSALTTLHLTALNRNDSVSSLYSRSTNGDTLPALSESGGTLTPSSSTYTLRAEASQMKGIALALESENHVSSSWEAADGNELETMTYCHPVRLSARQGLMGMAVKDVWVESPTLPPLRTKSCSPRKKISKVRGSTGGEHSMF